MINASHNDDQSLRAQSERRTNKQKVHLEDTYNETTQPKPRGTRHTVKRKLNAGKLSRTIRLPTLMLVTTWYAKAKVVPHYAYQGDD